MGEIIESQVHRTRTSPSKSARPGVNLEISPRHTSQTPHSRYSDPLVISSCIAPSGLLDQEKAEKVFTARQTKESARGVRSPRERRPKLPGAALRPLPSLFDEVVEAERLSKAQSLVGKREACVSGLQGQQEQEAFAVGAWMQDAAEMLHMREEATQWRKMHFFAEQAEERVAAIEEQMDATVNIRAAAESAVQIASYEARLAESEASSAVVGAELRSAEHEIAQLRRAAHEKTTAHEDELQSFLEDSAAKALEVECVRTEAVKHGVIWASERERLLEEIYELQAHLSQRQRQMFGLEAKAEFATDSSARHSLHVEDLERARHKAAEESANLHAAKLQHEQEISDLVDWCNEASEAHHCATLRIRVLEATRDSLVAAVEAKDTSAAQHVNLVETEHITQMLTQEVARHRAADAVPKITREFGVSTDVEAGNHQVADDARVQSLQSEVKELQTAAAESTALIVKEKTRANAAEAQIRASEDKLMHHCEAIDEETRNRITRSHAEVEKYAAMATSKSEAEEQLACDHRALEFAAAAKEGQFLSLQVESRAAQAKIVLLQEEVAQQWEVTEKLRALNTTAAAVRNVAESKDGEIDKLRTENATLTQQLRESRDEEIDKLRTENAILTRKLLEHHWRAEAVNGMPTTTSDLSSLQSSSEASQSSVACFHPMANVARSEHAGPSVSGMQLIDTLVGTPILNRSRATLATTQIGNPQATRHEEASFQGRLSPQRPTVMLAAPGLLSKDVMLEEGIQGPAHQLMQHDSQEISLRSKRSLESSSPSNLSALPSGNWPLKAAAGLRGQRFAESGLRGQRSVDSGCPLGLSALPNGIMTVPDGKPHAGSMLVSIGRGHEDPAVEMPSGVMSPMQRAQVPSADLRSAEVRLSELVNRFKSALPGNSHTTKPAGGGSAMLPLGFGLGRSRSDALHVDSMNMEDAAVADAFDMDINDGSRNCPSATMGHLQGGIFAIRRHFNARKGDVDVEDTGPKDETIRAPVTAAAATVALMSDRFRSGSCGSSALPGSPKVARSPERVVLQQAQMRRLEAISPARSRATSATRKVSVGFIGGDGSGVPTSNSEESMFLDPRASSFDSKVMSAQPSDVVNGGTYLGSRSPTKRHHNPSALDALGKGFTQVKTIQYVTSVNQREGCVSSSVLGQAQHIPVEPSRSGGLGIKKL